MLRLLRSNILHRKLSNPIQKPQNVGKIQFYHATNSVLRRTQQFTQNSSLGFVGSDSRRLMSRFRHPPHHEKLVKVFHGDQSAIFKVKDPNYTFSQMLDDSKRYFVLDHEFDLQELENSVALPYSSTILSHYGDVDSVSLILIPKGKILRQTHHISQDRHEIRDSDEEFISNRPTEKPNNNSNAAFELKLTNFTKSQWVRNKVKGSYYYLPTDLHYESAMISFVDFVHRNIERPAFKSLQIMLPELNDADFQRRVLPIFFSFLNSQSLDIKTKNRRELIRLVTNLKEPHTWYSSARSLDRKIILHCGPTNSGKTHSALTKLAHAKSGIYCGPLRLLAAEIHERLNRQGVKCNLVTGQQRIEIEGANHVSCTVEMADLNRTFDVGVIDEIQMLSSPDRGWAWTKALLGLPVKELHLCGDPSTLSLLKKIAKLCGEPIEINEYNRLSPLIPLDESLVNPFKNLSKGDCIVAFSRREIYKLKAEVERNTTMKCCVIYGSLPPESRAQQAALFNNPTSGYDILIASDAIGMGLNLNIKRLVFSTLQKYDGKEMRNLSISEIKQIAGRAGRYGTAFPEGYVVCFESKDLPLLHSALATPVPETTSAGLFPNYEQLDVFARCMSKGEKTNMSFVEILDSFAELTKLDSNYFLSDYTSMSELAAVIDHLPMSLKDKYSFLVAPVDYNNPLALSNYLTWSTIYSTGKNVDIRLSLPSAASLSPRNRLRELESLHHCLDLYLWLSFRFPEFHERVKANNLKEECGIMIEKALEELSGELQEDDVR